jgi:hypothetical protein
MKALEKIELEDIDEKVVLLSIARTYKPHMDGDETTIYEISKQAWYLDKNTGSKDLVEYALAMHQNIVKGVFSVDKWKKYEFEPHKWEFEGRIAPDLIRDKYLNKKIPMAFGEGQYNSSRLLNCNS